MINTICIIGFGSIGQKHYLTLKKIFNKNKIYIYSRRKIKENNLINTKNKLRLINPDYFIISNETALHLTTLKFINKNFKNKIILCEKPIYNKLFDLKILNNNKIYVGYNLRFDPIIIFLKKYLKKKKILTINIFCHSYLPNWRKRKYTFTSSASKKSGGVLYDLSHEIDYANLLFGPIKAVNNIYKKISSLKINSKDYFSGNFINNKNIPINISLSYFSFIEKRNIEIFSNKFYLNADLVNRRIFIQNQYKDKIIKFEKIDTYKEMHLEILNNKVKKICKFDNGLEIINIIKDIK